MVKQNMSINRQSDKDKEKSYLSESDVDIDELNDYRNEIEQIIQSFKINHEREKECEQQLEELKLIRIKTERTKQALEYLSFSDDSKKKALAASMTLIEKELAKINRKIKEQESSLNHYRETSKNLLPQIREHFSRLKMMWIRFTNGFRGSPPNIIDACQTLFTYTEETTGRVDYDEGGFAVILFSEWLIFFKQLIDYTMGHHQKLAYKDHLDLERLLLHKSQQQNRGRLGGMIDKFRGKPRDI
jgi:DNA repair exonuclease SbcCD ATPase subunit